MKLENQVCSEFRKLRGGGYHAVHKWLIRHFGKADYCENINCEHRSLRFQWALLKGKKYEHKRENFMKLCQVCHRNYDDNEEWRNNIGITTSSRTHTEESKKKISESMKGKNKGVNNPNYKEGKYVKS